MAVVFLCMAIVTLRGNFFDEVFHWPAALTTARGIIPPAIPAFPDVVHPYHWGVDALYAELVIAGLPVQLAVDAITLLCAGLLLALAWVLGARFAGGTKGATVTALVLPFAGSALAWPLFQLGHLSLPSPYPDAWSGILSVPMPLIAVFFQHPQGLAMPLFIAVLLLFCRDITTPVRIVGTLLLALVSLANTVTFGALGLGLGGAALYRATRHRSLQMFAVDTGALLAALALALSLGGMLSSGASFAAGAFFQDPLLLRVARHVVLFGLPLLGLLFFVRDFGQLGVTLASIAVVCYLAPNFLVLENTWDIVKFYDVGQFSAGILFAIGLGRAYQAAHRRAVVLLAAAFTTVVPVLWLMVNAAAPFSGVEVNSEISAHRAFDGLRRAFTNDIPPRSNVLTDDPRVGNHTGFFTPGFSLSGVFDPYRYFGIARAEAAAAQAHWAQALQHLRRQDLDALKIDFVLVTASTMARLSPEGREALDDRARFIEVNRVEGATLMRVLRRP